ncbi:hypothetical protein ISF6_5375 [Piscinibacter sakaiensis]|uniref:Uncharacterized protein n=1 Tax=Piscinibacter sakaiensis TaxID=1547922 RepID=A0A0K8NWA1_PISS1|nr:hypothetical protein ISF6_5375 [Piscinibacter sakaiensis]
MLRHGGPRNCGHATPRHPAPGSWRTRIDGRPGVVQRARRPRDSTRPLS